MRVLWLTVGDRQVASSRVRAYAPAEELTRQGVQCAVVPIGANLGRKLAGVAQLARHDVIVLQKLTPSRAALRIVRRCAKTLVWDCDDAVHLGYPGETQDAAGRRGRAIATLLDQVDVVTTTNGLLASELQPASGRVLEFPGPAPAPRLGFAEPRDRVVIWLGSKSTTDNLRVLGAATQDLAAAGWRCVAVGAEPRAEALGWEVHAWSYASETAWLARAAVGVMPLARDPWSDRKAGYKTLEYLAAGVVPVASDAPAAVTALGTAESGILVQAGRTWLDAVEEAYLQRDLFIAAGLRRLEELSVERFVRGWLDVIAEG